MSQAAPYTGRPVSEGTAAGLLHQADPGPPADATAGQVRAAFAAVAADRHDLAERLRVAGRAAEADIIGVAALIAADPALVGPAVTAVAAGTDAATAVAGAAEAQAAVLSGLAVPELAEPDGQHAVLDAVAGELRIGPAAGAGLVAGGSAVAEGSAVAGGSAIAGGSVTGADGTAAGAAPAAGSGPAAMAGNGRRQARYAGPAATADGHEITVLCNVASAAETRTGLAHGATGVGLLRTEIPFTEALAWPTLAEHRAHLAPILGLLAGRTVTVRLLDFSGDKIPPFLAGPRGAGTAATTGTVPAPGSWAGAGPGVTAGSGAAPGFGAGAGPGAAPGFGAGAGPGVAAGFGADAGHAPGAGLAAFLAHPTALRDQLRAILEAGREARLGVLIPMVSSPGEVDQVRTALAETAAATGAAAPRLGIMVELAATAAAAETFAPAVDFFSIGTNDLAGQVLGLDRRDPTARPALAADPRVLGLIRHVTQAARKAGIGVSVCGDAAADAQVLPLLIGLGVDTLSVPAARVERVRSWVAGLDAGSCAELAARALAAETVAAVWKLVPPL